MQSGTPLPHSSKTNWLGPLEVFVPDINLPSKNEYAREEYSVDIRITLS